MENDLKIVDGELHIGKDIYEVNYSDASGREYKLDLKQKNELLELMTKALKQMDKIPDDLDGLKMNDEKIVIRDREIKTLDEQDHQRFLKITTIFDRALNSEFELSKKPLPPKLPPKPTKMNLKPIVSKSPVPGFILIKVPGNGDCLFNSVGKSIPNFNELGGQQGLRNKVAEELTNNKENYKHYFEYAEFVNPKTKQNWSFDDHINDIKKMPEAEGSSPCYKLNEKGEGVTESRRGWGGEIEFQAIPKILKRPIVLYWPNRVEKPTGMLEQLYKGDLEITLAEAKKDPNTIFIYYNGTDHYNALQPEKK